MPPKKKAQQDKESKKNTEKKKKMALDDKTFGLKNKNKSSKVQAQVRAAQKSIMNSGDPQQRKADEKRKQMKLASKARKKAEQQERDALFNEALVAVSKKTTTKTKGNVEAKGRDHEEDGAGKGSKAGTSRAMKLMYQMDAKEAAEKLHEDPNYVPTIEDEIEQKRQEMFDQLKKDNTKGTPVTEETLRLWLERKKKRKADAARKLVIAEMKKKKGGKGLAVLTGRALYEYNRDLFKDGDDGGAGAGGGAGDGEGDTKDVPAATSAATTADDSGVANGGVVDNSGGGGGATIIANGDNNGDDKKMPAATTAPAPAGMGGVIVDDGEIQTITEKVQSDLFLDGDDDDLDDLDDLDDD